MKGAAAKRAGFAMAMFEDWIELNKGSIIKQKEELSMNKTELVAAIAEQAELSKKDTEKALKALST